MEGQSKFLCDANEYFSLQRTLSRMIGSHKNRFEEGPRLPGARYMDMVDIATTKELYPDLNPKGLFAMLPQKVSALHECASSLILLTDLLTPTTPL